MQQTAVESLCICSLLLSTHSLSFDRPSLPWSDPRRQRERKRSRNAADGDAGDGSAQPQRPVPAAGSPALPPPALLGGLPLLPTSIGGIINNPAASALPTAQRMPGAK